MSDGHVVFTGIQAAEVECMCAEIIDDIIDHTDTTNTRLIRETKHIKILNHKSGACCKFCVGVLHVSLVDSGN